MRAKKIHLRNFDAHNRTYCNRDIFTCNYYSTIEYVTCLRCLKAALGYADIDCRAATMRMQSIRAHIYKVKRERSK